MACHSMGEGNQKEGGTFAANLSRVGEKDNYDYLVRWIHNPRERTLPYCPFEKRDLTEEDYKKKGVPFVFDFDHSKCPNDGHERSEEHTSELQSQSNLVCRLLLEKKKKQQTKIAVRPTIAITAA